MNKNEKWYKVMFTYILLAIGTLIMAISLNCFLAPSTIAPGGVTGFAVVLNKSCKVPIYLTNLAINIPLFMLGAKTLGKVAAIKTLYATITLTFFLKFIPQTNLTDDILLAAIFGGLTQGLGLGIVFKFGGTTGGTDLAGSILHKKFPLLSPAKFMMLIDIFVVIFAGVVEKKIEISLYSVIAMYVIVKVTDLILEGIGYLKGFFIVTTKQDEISERLMLELDRGVTALKGKGMYTKQDRDVLLCVVSRIQFTRVKEIIKEIDPSAFVMVTDMSEALGEGFTEAKK